MTEEMAELKTRIGDINKTVGEMEKLMALRESRAGDLCEKVDKILQCLIEDGSMNKPSVIVRLDRVEQITSEIKGDANKPSMGIRMDRAEQINAALKWVCAAVVLLVINAIFERMKHG